MDLNLPIFKQVVYISPSAFNAWLGCEYKTYLKRQSGLPYVEEPPSLYAEIGTVFDALVKEYIMKRRGMKIPALNLDYTLKKITNKEALVEGKAAAALYIKTPLIHKFLSAGEVYLEQELYARRGSHDGESHVPILGRIDLIYDGKVVDWKCRGWGSRTSPTQGYSDRYDCQRDSGSIIQRLPHELAMVTRLEEVNVEWATQMLFYNWLLRHTQDECDYEIHEIVRSEQGYTICKHTGNISQAFSIKITKKLHEMWERLTANLYTSVIAAPNPCTELCHKYNSLCEVAHFCEFYAKWSKHAKPDNAANEETLHRPDITNFFT